MKALLATITIATALCATLVSASAADLPTAPTYQPAPPPVAARVYNWTGFYIGVNGGGAWGNQDALNIITDRFDSLSTGISGGVFGGTLGVKCRWPTL